MDNLILDAFHSGHSIDSYKLFGAHVTKVNNIKGVRFTVWAPNASRVEVIGEFNDWTGHDHELLKLNDNGVWSLFVSGNLEGQCYKYRIFTKNHQILDKADPYAFYSELRPATASIIYNLDKFKWNDKRYLNKRSKNFDKPVNIYEFHAGSWKRHEDGSWYDFNKITQELIPYCLEKGFTHIEFLPLSEHPFDGSWGYQTSGYFSCTSRWGKPKDFMNFVKECHKVNIGVIMDMVPVHFVKNGYGLIEFDGSRLYEYEKDSDAFSQWDTMNFDLWKEEVRSFLMSATAFWIDYFHVDGIRFDAVSNLIYWDGNKDRGENQGSIAFMKRLNYHLSQSYPSVMLVAEDSSDFANVTKSTLDGGLGFDYKWDLGWMNDTLKYYELDPIYREYNHHKLTFSMAYFYYEKFLLPLSHDEVVHGKKTIIDKMWGTYEQKVAQVKNLYTYQFTHPGKKLNFMGNEIAMFREWDEDKEVDWQLLTYPVHQALERFFKDISHLYLHSSALNSNDYEADKFKWIDADNTKQQIYSYYRESDKAYNIIVLNMSPISYESFKLGVPISGNYLELINSEKDIYHGCNMCNYKPIKATKEKINNLDYCLDIRLAPFAAIIFEVEK